MAKRRGRKNVKRASTANEEGPSMSNDENSLKDQEGTYKCFVERQCAAIMALRDVETEQLRTMLRLMRSYFTKDQHQVPVLQFFKENLQNLSIVSSGKDGQCEVYWKDNDGNLSMELADQRNLHSTLLHRLSMGYPNYSAAVPSFGGFEFSNETVKASFFGAENLQIRGFSLEEPSETQQLELPDALQTPGASSHRLSIGMTPKTLRLPKPGEMLLSVRGSPLGMFKEESMEAIQESEDG